LFHSYSARKGSALLKEHGLLLTHPELAGPDTSMPQAIRSLLGH